MNRAFGVYGNFWGAVTVAEGTYGAPWGVVSPAYIDRSPRIDAHAGAEAAPLSGCRSASQEGGVDEGGCATQGRIDLHEVGLISRRARLEIGGAVEDGGASRGHRKVRRLRPARDHDEPRWIHGHAVGVIPGGVRVSPPGRWSSAWCTGRTGSRAGLIRTGSQSRCLNWGKASRRGSAAVGVGGGGEVRRGGKAGHGDVAAGGVHRDAVPLVIVVPAQKAGVNQRGRAALGGVDDAQEGVLRTGKICSGGRCAVTGNLIAPLPPPESVMPAT